MLLKNPIKKKLYQEESGIALILILMVTAIIAVIVLEFTQYIKVTTMITHNYKDELEASAIARSGIEFAKYALKSDDPEVDHLNEDWAKDYSKILSSVMFKNGNLKLNIVDESSKFNLNTVILPAAGGHSQEKRYDSAVNNLKHLCEINNQDYKFVDALVDWIDNDDDVTIIEGQMESGGAEDSYYQGLTPPYHCKNAPLDTLKELFLIKGFTYESYAGSEDKDDATLTRTGLKDFLTIYGFKININTAPSEVLMALNLDIDKNLADNIIKERKENPFKSITDLKNVEGMTDNIYNRINKRIEIKSTGYFSLYSVGTVNKITSEIYAILYRASKDEISVIYWKEM